MGLLEGEGLNCSIWLREILQNFQKSCGLASSFLLTFFKIFKKN